MRGKREVQKRRKNGTRTQKNKTYLKYFMINYSEDVGIRRTLGQGIYQSPFCYLFLNMA